MFEITNATLDNSGNYSATVNNSFGPTTLTYAVFVGGKTPRPCLFGSYCRGQLIASSGEVNPFF